MNATQQLIASYLRNSKFDPSVSIDRQLSIFNQSCLAGMIETGEAMWADLEAVGGVVLVAAVAKTVQRDLTSR